MTGMAASVVGKTADASELLGITGGDAPAHDVGHNGTKLMSGMVASAESATGFGIPNTLGMCACVRSVRRSEIRAIFGSKSMRESAIVGAVRILISVTGTQVRLTTIGKSARSVAASATTSSTNTEVTVFVVMGLQHLRLRFRS